MNTAKQPTQSTSTIIHAHRQFPPNFERDAEGWALLGRLALLGSIVGIIAGLCVFQLSWWLAVVVLALWVVGSLFAGCVAALVAKKHRAGVGYPADSAAWLRSFSLTYTVIGAVVGALTVALAVGGALTLSPESGANYTPAVLAAIIAALAAAVMRWVSQAAPQWLLFGGR